jgi:hypothetical protein
MTSYIHNVKNSAGKAPATVVSVLALFGALLATLPQMIADERDLGGYSGQDPAVDPLIMAADASLAVSKTACARVLAAHTTGAPIYGPERALIRVAQLFHKVMDSADPEEVARLRAHAGLRRWAWLVPSTVVGSRFINHQINTALDALELWLALDDVFDARAADWSGWADYGQKDDGDCAAAPAA